MEEDEDGEDDTGEQESGVTAAYQTLLLEAHHKVYPPGSCSPYGLGHKLEVVYVDADPPYHQEPRHLEKIAHKIARVIVSQLKRRQYNPI